MPGATPRQLHASRGTAVHTRCSHVDQRGHRLPRYGTSSAKGKAPVSPRRLLCRCAGDPAAEAIGACYAARAMTGGAPAVHPPLTPRARACLRAWARARSDANGARTSASRGGARATCTDVLRQSPHSVVSTQRWATHAREGTRLPSRRITPYSNEQLADGQVATAAATPRRRGLITFTHPFRHDDAVGRAAAAAPPRVVLCVCCAVSCVGRLCFAW